MRLNTANRAFTAIVGLSVATFTLFALMACWIFGIFLYRLATDGLATFTSWSTAPAVVLLALLVTSNALVLRSWRAHAVNTRSLAGWVRAHEVPVPELVRQAAAGASLERRLVAVEDDAAFSFTYGLSQPRVAVSRGLWESLDGDELAAVLEHERYHVVNHDPLKVVLARSLPSALFFLPALRDLRERSVAARELAADRRAVAATGRQGLAGALFKVVAGPRTIALGATAAIGGDEALDARVEQLETGAEPAPAPISRGAVAASVAGAGLLLTSAGASIAAFAPLMARLCTGG